MVYFLMRIIQSGEVLLEYAGELISTEEGDRREEMYQALDEGNFSLLLRVPQ